MKTRYLALAAGVVLLAIVLTLLGRPRRAETPALATPTAPVVALALTIENGRVAPELASVPKGARVELHVDVRGARAARLALAGYEDRLTVPTLAPGKVWSGEFLADRPGEDFAWLVDGAPAGRFAVTGSHLIEGHR